MTFLSILVALLFEQLKPLRADNPIWAEFKRLAVRMEQWFNAGHASHGRLGWFLLIGALTLPAGLVYWLLLRYNLVLAAFAWNVLIVYLTLGFRHYSHYFTSIQLALNAGDESQARALLADTDWPVFRIATETGFASDAHFCRVFRAETGTTPKAYRDQARGNAKLDARSPKPE